MVNRGRLRYDRCMDFTIVTPSFRQLEYLACCISSVADQEGVEVEHLVQDGGTPGFDVFSERMAKQWPDRPGYRRIMVSEKDGGMYDAINRGLQKASGQICAYLNCDEQYLPGVLQVVLQRFRDSPETDVYLGDVLVVGPGGEAVCHRKMIRPGLAHTWTCHFGALTAGIFFRRKVVDLGVLFDTSYRAAADADWFVRMLKRGIRVQTLGLTTTSFMESGENLGLSRTAQQERERLSRSAPWWMRAMRPCWVLLHRMRRVLHGAHSREDVSYPLFFQDGKGRKDFYAARVRTTWPGRWWNY